MFNLRYCPKCNSTNLSRLYVIPTNSSKLITIFDDYDLDRCLDCKYEDKLGSFESINRKNLREDKINNLLNGIS